MLIQVAIGFFGLLAMWLSQGTNQRGRRWAPLVGLCGQPFWIWYATHATQAQGILVLTCAWCAVYVRGGWVQWRLWKAQRRA